MTGNPNNGGPCSLAPPTPTHPNTIFLLKQKELYKNSNKFINWLDCFYMHFNVSKSRCYAKVYIEFCID